MVRPTKTFSRIALFVLHALGASVILAAVLSGKAEAAWPERTITIIVPFPQGGPNDFLGRLLASELAFKLGQKVVVENRVGKSGNEGLTAAALNASNGYYLLVTTNAVLINPLVDPNVMYRPLKDFAPIAYLGAAPNVIVTRPAAGIVSMADLIDKARAESGKLTCATPGVGTSSHLTAALLKLRTKTDLTVIPMDGSDLALMAALSGATDIASINIASLIGYIRSGKLIGLAQTGSDRSVVLPDITTLAEAGIPDAVLETSQMLLTGVYTPASIIEKLEQATKEILERPSIKAEMLRAGFLVKFEGSDDLQAHMLRDIATYKEIIERAGIKKRFFD